MTPTVTILTTTNDGNEIMKSEGVLKVFTPPGLHSMVLPVHARIVTNLG